MSSPRARTRVSQACIVCSGKKIKCDGKLPECGTCVLNGKKCVYGISKRNTRINKTLLYSHGTPNSDLHVSPIIQAAPTQQMPQHHPSLDSISRADKEHLFRTFFSCIHPIWPVLYKPLYDGVAYSDLATLLAPPVVYAIFALASCIQTESTPSGSGLDPDSLDGGDAEPQSQSSSSRAFPAPKTTAFFDAALYSLQIPTSTPSSISPHTAHPSLASALTPSIPSCQALTLLALHQHGVANFSHAAMLCAVASAMALELRLHRDAWTHDAVAREVASRLFWNVFVLDHMLAGEMGRPFALRAEDADAPYPETGESDEFELLSRSRGVGTMATATATAAGAGGEIEGMLGIKLRTLSAFHWTIELAALMERVCAGIYGLRERKKMRGDRKYGDQVRMELSDALDAWRTKAAASSLRLEYTIAVTPPAMVTNYLFVQNTKLLVHRPFIAFWEASFSSTGQAPFPTPDPAEVCFQSAKDICLILDTYSKYLTRLPSDLIFVIFSVTETLFRRSSQLRHEDAERAQIQRYVRQCLHWLGIFGRNWRNASARQELLRERYNWPSSLDPNPEPAHPDPVPAEGDEYQDTTGFGLELQSNYSLDEAQFNEIWNEIRDWGFLPSADDALYRYQL